ncbi:thioredoxin family protein [Namhaeicola litoreus]|uniref:Thioredoxin family protein n=1 Tax=Namhaeicola litoreus TaxID=1052145 RepID=A0ABW3Y6N1_9FLAO
MRRVIKILGTGCQKCRSMTGVVNDVVSENNIDATVEKVEDIMEIMKFNVLTTPALVIDEVITIKGRVPSKEEVLSLLEYLNPRLVY